MSLLDSPSSLSYTNKDFNTIYTELLEYAKKLSYRWDPSTSDESDPGVVLLKLAALIGDKDNYNIDQNVLELMPATVSQSSSARQLFDQCGYSMRHYVAAKGYIELTVKSELGENTTEESYDNIEYRYEIPMFTMFSDVDNSIIYTSTETIKNVEPKTPVSIPVIEGTVNTYSINNDSLITVLNLDSNNRLYFKESNIAENGIYIKNVSSKTVSYSNFDEWKCVDNLQIQAKGTRCYKFGLSLDDSSCYIEFPDDVEDLFEEGINLYYIVTKGSAGNVSTNILSKLYVDTKFLKYSLLTSEEVDASADRLRIRNTAPIITGKDPESITDAYRNYKRERNTFDTLVSLKDYTDYMITEESASNGYVCDRTNDIQHAYKVVTTDDENTVIKSYVHQTEKERQDTKGSTIKETVPEMNAFNLCVYALEYVPTVLDVSSFKSTFNLIKVSESDKMASSEKVFNPYEVFNDPKSLQHDFLPFETDRILMLKNRYSLTANVVPRATLSASEKGELLYKIECALCNAVNSKELYFGDPVSIDVIQQTILNCDERIKALIDFMSPTYETYAVYLNSENKLEELRIDNSSKDGGFVETKISSDTFNSIYSEVYSYDGTNYTEQKDALYFKDNNVDMYIKPDNPYVYVQVDEANFDAKKYSLYYKVNEQYVKLVTDATYDKTCTYYAYIPYLYVESNILNETDFDAKKDSLYYKVNEQYVKLVPAYDKTCIYCEYIKANEPYEEVQVTEANFDAKKDNLYIYDTVNEQYVKLSTDATYDDTCTYYELPYVLVQSNILNEADFDAKKDNLYIYDKANKKYVKIVPAYDKTCTYYEYIKASNPYFRAEVTEANFDAVKYALYTYDKANKKYVKLVATYDNKCTYYEYIPYIKVATLDKDKYIYKLYYLSVTGDIVKVNDTEPQFDSSYTYYEWNPNQHKLWLKFRSEIFAKNVLAGVTPLFTPANKYTTSISQQDSKEFTGVSDITTNTTLQLKGYSYNGTSGIPLEDAEDYEGLVEDGKTDSNAQFLTEGYYWMSDPLKECESILLETPNIIKENNYASYVKVVYHFPSLSSKKTIEANAKHKLHYAGIPSSTNNDFIAFFYKPSSEDTDYTFKVYSGCDSSLANYISPTFNLPVTQTLDTTKLDKVQSDSVYEWLRSYIGVTQTTFKTSSSVNKTFPIIVKSSDGTEKTISTTEFVEDYLISSANYQVLTGTNMIDTYNANEILINNKKNGCNRLYWITNNVKNNRCVLFDAGTTQRKLRSGEYFFYTDADMTRLYILGQGTRLTRGTGNLSEWTVPKISYEELLEKGIDLLMDNWHPIVKVDDINSGMALRATEYSQTHIGPLNSLKLTLKNDMKDKVTYDNGKLTTEYYACASASIDSTGLSSTIYHHEDVTSPTKDSLATKDFSISYVDFEGNETKLPDVTDGYEISTLLSLDIDKDKPQKIYAHQKLNLSDGTTSQKVEGSDESPVYIQSNTALKFVGDSTSVKDALATSSTVDLFKYEYNEQLVNDNNIYVEDNTIHISVTNNDPIYIENVSVCRGNYLLRVVPSSDSLAVNKIEVNNIPLERLSSSNTYKLSVSSDATLKFKFTLEINADTEELNSIKIPPLYKYTTDVIDNISMGKDSGSFESILLSRIEEWDTEGKFDYTYQPNNPIHNPLISIDFLKKQHFYNKFTICEWDTTIDGNVTIHDVVR